jgi:hypothetical protein
MEYIAVAVVFVIVLKLEFVRVTMKAPTTMT